MGAPGCLLREPLAMAGGFPSCRAASSHSRRWRAHRMASLSLGAGGVGGWEPPEATFPVWNLGRPQSPLCAWRSLGNGAAPAVFPPLLRESELGTCQCSCLTTVSHLQGELCWRSCSASRRTGLQKKQRSSACRSLPWGFSFLSVTASGNCAGRTPSPAQFRLM